MPPSSWPRLSLILGMVVAACLSSPSTSLRIGDYEVNFSLSSLLGTKDERMSPEQYGRALQADAIKLRTLKIPSTFLYIYPSGGYKRAIYNKIQDMEVDAVEKALGIKFWRIGVDGLGGLTLFHTMRAAYTAPRRPNLLNPYYQSPPLSLRRHRQKKKALRKYPLFINLTTGRGLQGMTAAVDLADLVLGNPVKKPDLEKMPSLEDSPIQQRRRMKHSAFKMIMFEKTFGKEAIMGRLVTDRDRAYKKHRKQYRVRKVLGKLGLGPRVPAVTYEEDEDMMNEQIRDALRVRGALGSRSRTRR